MIYKASPIRVHRVEISSAQDQFFPTTDLTNRLFDLQVLSHFNEDQSMMHQYPGFNHPPSDGHMNAPYTQFLAPFREQTSTAEHHRAPSMVVPPRSPDYERQYTHLGSSAGAFEETTKLYKVSTVKASYNSFSGTLPTSSTYFHPPMLAPSHHYSSPPPASPIPSTSPGPSPRQPELQIRLSQPCYEMGQRHHEILPLETGPFKK